MTIGTIGSNRKEEAEIALFILKFTTLSGISLWTGNKFLTLKRRRNSRKAIFAAIFDLRARECIVLFTELHENIYIIHTKLIWTGCGNVEWGVNDRAKKVRTGHYQPKWTLGGLHYKSIVFFQSWIFNILKSASCQVHMKRNLVQLFFSLHCKDA